MNKAPVKVLVQQLQRQEHAGDQKPLKLVLLTDTSVLQALVDKAKDEGYACHNISNPGSASGIDDITIEVVATGGSKKESQYFKIMNYGAPDVIQVATL